jgi:hypothetical protein
MIKTPNVWPTNTRDVYSLLIFVLNLSPLLQTLQCWMLVPLSSYWRGEFLLGVVNAMAVSHRFPTDLIPSQSMWVQGG